MDDESLKIYEVAERTGYADSRYFSVCYKKYWHITPLIIAAPCRKAAKREYAEADTRIGIFST